MTAPSRPWAFRRPARPRSATAGPKPRRPAPAWEFHRSIPGYAPTPLVSVPALAKRWDVDSAWVKDESCRLGLPAFKILGASWAVNRAVTARTGQSPAHSLAALRAVAAGSAVSLVTATDGNHGRAVAHMARLLGLPARIYVPGGLPAGTLQAIRSEGAAVIDTGALYDEAVALAASDLAADDLLVQDTAWEGYEEVPGWIVDGYSTLFAEVDEQLLGAAASVVAVPTGVGSLLQAALHRYGASGGPTVARVLAVEPVTAACVTDSLSAGRPVTLDTSAGTCMAGLNCGTVSRTAWPVIRESLDAAIGVTDDEAAAAVLLLRENGIDAGPCGAAALAGVDAALAAPDGPEILGLGPRARVLLISTEGSAEASAEPTGTAGRAGTGGG